MQTVHSQPQRLEALDREERADAVDREWTCNTKHAKLYSDPIKVPSTYDDDYAHRAAAASAAENKVRVNMSYRDLSLKPPADESGARAKDTEGGDLDAFSELAPLLDHRSAAGRNYTP